MLWIITNRWLLVAVCVVGIVLSPVLLGFAPLGGDPELMYQPIKTELARALATGQLPFWSDYFGIGIPLIAESHVAAFYPLNWLLYWLCDVPTAYQLSLWLHALALVALTYSYARVLGISKAGSALAAIGFSLCGFQAVHAVHEPFYSAMPYLPLCLLLADRYAMSGQWAWLAGLALAWGAQITLGHFQIQMWTGGLALLTGVWRVFTSGQTISCRLRRVWGLTAAFIWGAAIAWIQLRLTWEMTLVSGFDRRPKYLANHLLPPAHVAQFALPAVYLGRPRGLGEIYWAQHGTTAGEACAYVGVVVLLLAFVGAAAALRHRGLAIWRVIVPLSLVLATLPGWLPDGFILVSQLPGIGWFRAPARYTLLTSLGLALFAGHGLDHAITRQRFWGGLALAVLVGAFAWAWSIKWASASLVQASFQADTIALRFATVGLAWVLGLAAIIGWRFKQVGAWAPLSIAALELSGLYYTGSVEWHWAIHLPSASPVLTKLAALRGAGLIGGRLLNLPIYAGQAVAYPNIGITPPPPNYLLESTMKPPGRLADIERRWQRRLGVTHSIWEDTDDLHGATVLAEIVDPELNVLMAGTGSPSSHKHRAWKIVSERTSFPPAWIARRMYTAENWGGLYTELSVLDRPEEAWFLPGDSPLPFAGDAAQTANVESWDGQAAVVLHDGACILILRRTYYPGWTYQLDGGRDQPVLRVDGGLQGIPLSGSGRRHVKVHYRPTLLARSVAVSLIAIVGALLTLVVSGLHHRHSLANL